MNQIHTIRVKVGQYTVGATSGFNFNDWFEIPLKNLPHHIRSGVGHVTEFELQLNGTFSTATGSAKIKSSDLHGWLDWQVIGVEEFVMCNRKGWHDPIRGALKFGYVEGRRSADIAANSSGSRVAVANTKLSKHFSLIEENMGPLSRFSRIVPSCALAQSSARIRVYVNGQDTIVRPATAAATGKWDALTITVYAHILDLPAANSVMPIFVEEASANALTDLNPTPGLGMYLRTSLVNSPFLAATEDNVGAYTKINYYGTLGNYSRYNEDVDTMLNDFHSELTDALEPHRPTDATLTNQKREFRILDGRENDDGVTRNIPLVYPRPGQEVSDMPRWYGTQPTLSANDDSRVGLPASTDILYDRIIARDPKYVSAILNALGTKARSTTPMANKAWQARPGVEVQRIPLIADGRE